MREFNFRENNFDLVRLIAALQVVIMHGIHHFGVKHLSLLSWLLSVFPGVPVFFALSGFLISASLERSSSLTSYIRNRVLRIYPALWVCFIISVMSVFISYSPQVKILEFIQWCVAQTTIAQFYNPDFLRGYGVGVLNGSLWTIPVELQFYFVLPFIYIFFDRLKWRPSAVAISLFLLVALNQFYTSNLSGERLLYIKLLGVTILPYLYMFLVGVILQRNLFFVQKYLANRALPLFLLYIASIAISELTGLRYQGNYLNPVSAVLLTLLAISFAYSYVGKFSTITRGNDISYGIYIYHMIFVNLLIQLSLFPPLGNLFLMLSFSIVFAALSWKLIEQPALALKKRAVKPN